MPRGIGNLVIACVLVGSLAGATIAPPPSHFGPDGAPIGESTGPGPGGLGLLGIPNPSPTASHGASIARTSDWNRILSRLAADSRLPPGFDGALGTSDSAARPPELQELLMAAAPGGFEPLELPTAADRSKPLIAALDTYAKTIGAALPEADILTAQVAALRLAPAAERALATLVLAYARSVEVSSAATSGLTEEDKATILSFTALEARSYGPDGVDLPTADAIARFESAFNKIDHIALLQAADLLARAVEATRGPLALPPVETPRAFQTVDPDDVEVYERPDEPPAAEPTQTPDPDLSRLAQAGSDDAWIQLLDVLEAFVPPRKIEPVDGPFTLADSLRRLDPGLPEEASSGLPPSLDWALGVVVRAHTEALNQPDPGVRAYLLVDAARTVEPTLAAWREILTVTKANPAGENPFAFALLEAVGGSASPPRLMGATADSLELRELAEVLTMAGVDPTEAAKVAAAVPPALSPRLAALLAAEIHLENVFAQTVGELGPEAAARLSHTAEVGRLLASPTWSPADAAFVAAWTTAVRSLPPDAFLELEGARARVAAAAEAVAHLDAPLLAAQLAIDQCASTCVNDVLVDLPLPRLGSDHRLLVTGSGTSLIRPDDGATPASIVIDLGGDDRYVGSTAFAEPWSAGVRPASSIVIDLGGDDEYYARNAFDQAAAIGPGALALLWDVAGDDRYQAGSHTPAAQGYGAFGGAGFLVDENGADRYAAMGAGQGVAQSMPTPDLAGPFPILGAPSNTVGALLDLGAGDDSFATGHGQGSAAGARTFGLLLETAGNSEYAASQPAQSRGDADPFDSSTLLRLDWPIPTGPSLAAFLDLGGDDAYGEAPLDDGWAQPLNGPFTLGIGLDFEPSNPEDPGPAEWIEGLLTPETASASADEPSQSPAPDAPSPSPETVDLPGLAPVAAPAAAPILEAPSACVFAGNCEDTGALLVLGGPETNEFDEPAVIIVDLGGDDAYLAPAVTPSSTVTFGNIGLLFGNLILDTSGNDVYGDATTARSVAAGSSVFAVVIDVLGEDDYFGAECSLASTCGGDDTLALLADLGGDDTYSAAGRSQGHSESGSVAILADLAGGETYRFVRQATVQGSGHAGVYDGDGDDTYDGSGTGQEPDLGDGVFSDQASIADAATGSPAVALFFDRAGDDTYLTGASSENPTDVSERKNNRLHVDHATEGEVPYPAIFADNPSAASEAVDRDQDEVLTVVERLLGTDPDDASDSPGGIFTDGTGSLDEGEPFIWAPDPVGDLGLQLPGLLIGGRDDSIVEEATGLMVDLGGDDVYLAPGIGGANVFDHAEPGFGSIPDHDYVRRSTLVLDVGAGNDTYVPAPHTHTATGADAHATLIDFQPSLGGAAGAVALLADDGGHNTFRSSITVRATATSPDSDVHALSVVHGASMGAGLFGGVGVLITWDAKNVFETTVRAEAREADAVRAPTAVANGVSQGAGWAGAGFLVAAGDGDDLYRIDATAEATGEPVASVARAAAVGQGATGSYGVGALVDLGGDNSFEAPSGTAQGAAERSALVNLLVMGPDANSGAALLWTGPGDDRFTGGPHSQGAALNLGGLFRLFIPIWFAEERAPAGVLINAGGNDEYVITDGLGEMYVQGAALGGAGVLLDWAGDDVYNAAQAGRAQGSAFSPPTAAPLGTTASQATTRGILIDGGGGDRYVAGPRSQGHGEGDALGLLVDQNGLDVYEAQSPSQGAGSRGVFADGEGRDRYEYPNELKQPQPAPPDANEWQWSQGAGMGFDHSTLDPLIEALWPNVFGDAQIGLSASRDAEGSDPLGPGEAGQGVLHLRATIEGASMANVNRVIFLLDGNILGHAERAEEAFTLAWDTAASEGGSREFPDAAYELRALAYIGPTAPSGSPLAAPDVHYVESDPLAIPVNNPPLIATSLSADGLSPRNEQTVELRIRASPDLACPGPGAPAGCVPGSRGRLTVTAQGPETVEIADLDLTDAETSIAIDGYKSPSVPWADGDYEVRVELVDSGGAATQAEHPLLVDGTPPESQLILPEPWVGESFRTGSNRLRIGWTAVDDGSGVAGVSVYRVNQTDDVNAVAQDQPPNVHEITVSAHSLERFRLFPVAVDQLGNQEAPCPGDPAAVCPTVKLEADPESLIDTQVDFVRPEVLDLDIAPAQARPGDVLEVLVSARDDQSGLDVIRFSVGDLGPVDLEHESGLDWSASYEIPVGLEGEDELAYVLVAQDIAGNSKTLRGHLLVDAEAPTVNLLGVDYVDAEGRPAQAGSGTGRANVRLAIFDAHTDSVVATVPAALGGPAAVDCARVGATQSTEWLCEILLPSTVADGSHNVEVSALDAAGNAAGALLVPLLIDGSLPEFVDAEVTSVRFDAARIRWSTEKDGVPTDATGQILYGKTSELGRLGPTLTTLDSDHDVWLTGLAPSTTYFAQIRAESVSGVANLSEMLTFRTTSAVQVEFVGVAANTPLRGDSFVDVRLGLLGDGGPADLALLVQDAAALSSPVRVGEATRGPGVHRFEFDTASFADGPYRLILQGTRPGDLNETTSPVVLLDNNAPILVPVAPQAASTVSDATPEIVLSVVDVGFDVPPLASLVVRLDDRAGTVEAAAYAGPSGASVQRSLEIALSGVLATGPHHLEVRLADRAGNVGIAQWAFDVDAAPPTLDVPARWEPVPGPTHAAPGGQIRVFVTPSDASPIAAVHVDLRALGGTLEPLQVDAHGNWSGLADLPASLAEGVAEIPIAATDALGNQGAIATLQVPVDATAPTLSNVAAAPHNFTAALVQFDANEPVIVELVLEGVTAAANATLLERHEVLLGDLQPNEEYVVTVVAIDGAGHEASAQLPVASLDDEDDPTAPRRLSATSPSEGVVQLTWEAATDNSAVASYEIVRFVNATSTLFIVSGAATGHTDTRAPPGLNATYRVYAVDLAGNTGPFAEASARALALPHLRDASVFPLEGPASQPFTFNVTFIHAGGRSPDGVVLDVGGTLHNLTRAAGALSCARGCTYTASVMLTPTSQFDARPPLLFRATVDEATASIPLSRWPLVFSGEDVGSPLGADGGGIPSLSPLVLLAVCFLIAAAQRRFRRQP